MIDVSAGKWCELSASQIFLIHFPLFPFDHGLVKYTRQEKLHTICTFESFSLWSKRLFGDLFLGTPWGQRNRGANPKSKSVDVAFRMFRVQVDLHTPPPALCRTLLSFFTFSSVSWEKREGLPFTSIWYDHTQLCPLQFFALWHSAFGPSAWLWHRRPPFPPFTRQHGDSWKQIVGLWWVPTWRCWNKSFALACPHTQMLAFFLSFSFSFSFSCIPALIRTGNCGTICRRRHPKNCLAKSVLAVFCSLWMMSFLWHHAIWIHHHGYLWVKLRNLPQKARGCNNFKLPPSKFWVLSPWHMKHLRWKHHDGPSMTHPIDTTLFGDHVPPSYNKPLRLLHHGIHHGNPHRLSVAPRSGLEDPQRRLTHQRSRGNSLRSVQNLEARLASLKNKLFSLLS